MTPRLAFGTAQLGFRYGIANVQGAISESDAVALVQAAMQEGIDTFDTARAYGDSERRIGIALADVSPDPTVVITKLDRLAGIGPDDRAAAVAAANTSIELSRVALRRDCLDVLLLHRAAHRTQWHGAVWDRLLAERNAGRISRLGVSVENTDDALSAIADVDVQHIQLPYNLLDWRWHRTGVIDALRQRPELTVHVRSVLLQGLLAGTVTPWPILGSQQTEILLERLHGLARTLRRESLPDLALAYVRAQTWISAVIVGMETKAQLATNIDLFKKSGLDPTECHRVDLEVPEVDAALLNPAQWKTLPDSADQVRDG